MYFYELLFYWWLPQPAELNFGAWADQTDFKPEVRKLCEDHKGACKNT